MNEQKSRQCLDFLDVTTYKLPHLTVFWGTGGDFGDDLLGGWFDVVHESLFGGGGDGAVEHGVGAGEGGHGVEVDGVAVGGLDAGFGGPALRVEDGDGGEAKNPAAGKVELHGHAGAAAGARAHDFYSGEVAHDRHEIVGRRECGAVGEDGHGFVPAQAVGSGRLIVVGPRLGEIVVAGACLVHHVANEGALGEEAPDKVLGIGKASAAVVAYVDNKAGAEPKVGQYIVDVAVAEARFKRRPAYVAHVLREDAVDYGAELAIVEAEVILFDQASVEILWIFAPPVAVIRCGKPGGKVYVAVA